ncbi:hypothetical protein ACCO45_010046 [Purpureocillium lilacinum]|uniref:Uncharacterized protein n=1 Tax=Purpureocillium lilacinum TaxID=33203 RepID=A0ACC4DEH9_PURLI
MDASPTLSTEEETTDEEKIEDCGNEICCIHKVCDPLRERALCRQWFFARWILKCPFLPGELPERLRTWLRGYEYRYSAAFRDARVYELLLKLDSGFHVGLRWDVLIQDEDVVDCQGELTGHWALACCCDAHQINARFWVARMTEPENGKFFFGDRHLPHQLLAEVDAAGGFSRKV